MEFFRRNEGSVMIMSALMFPVMCVAVAGAVEYTNAVNLRQKSQSIVDAAALAGATRGDDAGGEMLTHALGGLEFSAFRVLESAVATVDGETRAIATVRTTGWFGELGLGPMTIHVEASAIANRTPLDVVMVLDYSGSMGTDNKFQRMATAAQSLLDSLGTAEIPVRAGVVPFASYTVQEVEGRFLVDIDALNVLGTGDYITCASNRGYPHAVSSSTPSSAVLDSLWPATAYSLVDLGGTTVSTEDDWTRSSYGGIFSGWFGGFFGGGGGGSSESFASSNVSNHQAIEPLSAECQGYVDRNLMTLPLTSDLASLKPEIAAMTPEGATNISLGLDVAWHVLSENAPWTEGQDVPDAQQVVIALTDGVQTMEAEGSGGEVSVSAANRNTQELCENMKNDDVIMYTISFDINDTFTETLLQNCATSISHYFSAGSSTDLVEVFAEIYESLNQPARLTH